MKSGNALHSILRMIIFPDAKHLPSCSGHGSVGIFPRTPLQTKSCQSVFIGDDLRDISIWLLPGQGSMKLRHINQEEKSHGGP